jgi:drug/metabolite transporter (DMT)-like permease
LFFLKEKLDKGIIIGAVLLLTGNFLLLKMNNFHISTGDLLILAATLLWSIETIVSKQALHHLDSKVVALGRMLFGSMIIIAFLAITGKLELMASLTSSQLAWIGITSIFLTGYVFTWYSGLKEVKASIATSILLLGSVITALLDLAWGTPIVPTQIVGLVLLVLGTLFAVGLKQALNRIQEKIHSIFSMA